MRSGGALVPALTAIALASCASTAESPPLDDSQRLSAALRVFDQACFRAMQNEALHQGAQAARAAAPGPAASEGTASRALSPGKPVLVQREPGRCSLIIQDVDLAEGVAAFRAHIAARPEGFVEVSPAAAAGGSAPPGESWGEWVAASHGLVARYTRLGTRAAIRSSDGRTLKEYEVVTPRTSLMFEVARETTPD